MSIKKSKGLLDDLAYTRQFFDKSNQESGGAKYASPLKGKHKYKPLNISEQIRVAAKQNQAVIKITNYGREIAHISEHFAYISRNYKLELEDQEGEIIKFPKEACNLLDKWEAIYFDNKTNSRNTVHITFSAPETSNRDDFNKAIRNCLREEFGGRNDYVFAQHDDTKHPHAHAVIVMRSIHGKKLDPRKQYLSHLRGFFAEKCREQGILVESSRRFERGLGGKSRKSEMVQMFNQRGVLSKSDLKLKSFTEKGLNDDGLDIRKERNKSIRDHYFNTAKKLYFNAEKETNPEIKKRNIMASKLLLDFSREMPSEPTLGEQLMKVVNAKKEKGFYKDSVEVETIKSPKIKNKSSQKDKGEESEIDF